MFTIFNICPADHLKPKKKRILQKQFPRFVQFCVFFHYLKFGLTNFFLSTGTKKGTNMFNSPANLRKFHRRKRDKSCSKDPYFLYRKTSRNGKELGQDLYLNVRKLSNLSPFDNLLTVFSFRLTSLSGVEVLWILRVMLLKKP